MSTSKIPVPTADQTKPESSNRSPREEIAEELVVAWHEIAEASHALSDAIVALGKDDEPDFPAAKDHLKEAISKIASTPRNLSLIYNRIKLQK